RYSRTSGLEGEISCVLSALAHAANEDGDAVRDAFRAAAIELQSDRLELQPPERCTPRVLEASLSELAGLVPQQKKKLLAACAASIAADAEVTAGEAELFRVVADWLEVPAPPLLPGQRLA